MEVYNRIHDDGRGSRPRAGEDVQTGMRAARALSKAGAPHRE